MPAPDCPTTCPYAREMGEHSADIDNLKRDVHAICTRMDALIAGVQAIERLLAEQSGGRKALWAMLTAASMVGSAITGAFSKLLKGL